VQSGDNVVADTRWLLSDTWEAPLRDHWRKDVGTAAVPFLKREWEDHLFPTLAAKAQAAGYSAEQYEKICRRTWSVAVDLLSALHADLYRPKSQENASFYWRHTKFDLYRINDRSRGFDIDRQELSRTAARYLSEPDLQSNRLDWVLLDAFVFDDLDALGQFAFHLRGGTGPNWAAMLSAGKGEIHYAALAAVSFLIHVALTIAAPLWFVYYLANAGHRVGAVVAGAAWSAYLIWRVGTYPSRWRARRKRWKQFQQLIDIHAQLGQSTISPRKLRDSLDEAASNGVVMDGAVFSITDRMLARDPAVFIPINQSPSW
jgi:hypothetical protein